VSVGLNTRRALCACARKREVTAAFRADAHWKLAHLRVVEGDARASQSLLPPISQRHGSERSQDAGCGMRAQRPTPASVPHSSRREGAASRGAPAPPSWLRLWSWGRHIRRVPRS
jgi:hypothetical protein